MVIYFLTDKYDYNNIPTRALGDRAECILCKIWHTLLFHFHHWSAVIVNFLKYLRAVSLILVKTLRRYKYQ